MKNTKQKDITENKKGGYGILSMLAMIVGIVIASGIFFQNSGLIATTGNTIAIIEGWIVGSVLVLFMMIAFLEIFSITEITGEQSTIGNWGKHLYGIRFGRVIGYYYTIIYFPIAVAALFSFAANQMLTTVTNGAGFSTAAENLSFIISVAFIFMIIIGAMNTIAAKPGRIFQNIGTFVKALPIVFTIAFLIFTVFTNIGNIDFHTDGSLEPYYPDATSANPFMLMMLTLPPILFSFDGFIFAGSLSKEGKSKKTFQIASIIGIIVIIVLYLLFTIAVFGLGNPALDGYGSLGNVINAQFTPETAKWLAPLVNWIIVISIVTGASGSMIANSRMMSDLSVHNAIKDKDQELITKNKWGIAPTSTIYVLINAMFWFTVMTVLNSISIIDGGLDPLIATEQLANTFVIIAFLFYSIVLFGGIVNRITKKTEVKKLSLFIPSAIIAIIAVLGATIYFAYVTFFPGADGITNDYIIKLSASLLVIVVFIFTIIYNEVKSSTLTEQQIKAKYEAMIEYYNGDVPELDEVKDVIETKEEVIEVKVEKVKEVKKEEKKPKEKVQKEVKPKEEKLSKEEIAKRDAKREALKAKASKLSTDDKKLSKEDIAKIKMTDLYGVGPKISEYFVNNSIKDMMDISKMNSKVITKEFVENLPAMKSWNWEMKKEKIDGIVEEAKFMIEQLTK